MSHNLHIIALMRNYPPSVGGLQSLARMLYRQMAGRGVSVTIFLDSEQETKAYADGPINIVPVVLPKPFFRYWGPRHWRFMSASRKLIKTIIKQHQSAKKNVLHVHWPEDFFYTFWLNKRLNLPAVWTCHGGIAVKRVNQIFTDKSIFRKYSQAEPPVNSIVFVSEAIQRQLKIEPLRHVSQVIPNGIDIKAFRPQNKTTIDETTRLIYAGRLIPLKNISFVLRALSQYANKSWQLDLAGDGDEKEMLQQLVEELNLQAHVNFLGPQTDMATLYPKYDIYVSASKIEGLPISPIEAMSCGLLPLLSDIPQHRELVAGLPEALLFSNQSPESFGRALQFATEQLQTGLPRQVAQFAREKYDIERVAGQYIELFKQL